MSLAWIGLGGNLGDVNSNFDSALEALELHVGITVQKLSTRYRTAPIGYDNQPDFINAVARIETVLTPGDLLKHMQAAEHQGGRVRSDNRNAPRTLDLDLLMVDDIIMTSRFLTLPHPRMHERRFVLEPLVEIDPEIEIPGIGKAVELLAQLGNQTVEQIN